MITFCSFCRSRRATAAMVVLAAAFTTMALCALVVPGGLDRSRPERHTTALGGFPFPAVSTWVYSRVQYEPLGNVSRIVTATNLITETVVRAERTSPDQAFLHQQTASLVRAPQGWQDNSPNFNSQAWYRTNGTRVYSTPDGSPGINTLVYDFPFTVGKSWCPQEPPDYNPNCMSMGRRTVKKHTGYETPAGKFDDCYELSQDYNSGGTTEWYCNGVGVVARKYDHAGTPFGLQDTLLHFSIGSSLP